MYIFTHDCCPRCYIQTCTHTTAVPDAMYTCMHTCSIPTCSYGMFTHVTTASQMPHIHAPFQVLYTCTHVNSAPDAMCTHMPAQVLYTCTQSLCPTGYGDVRTHTLQLRYCTHAHMCTLPQMLCAHTHTPSQVWNIHR